MLTNVLANRYNNFCLSGVITLQINVQELLSRQEPVQLQGSFELKELFLDSKDVAPLSPLSFRMTASGSDGMIRVQGEITSKLRFQCSRCLDDIDEELHVEFEEQFKVMRESDPEPTDDDDFIPVYGERIELQPFLEEELVLHLPLAPLCDEACQGLCPECGSNRNEQSCDCKSDRVDPRLAALQDWFKPEPQ